MPIEPRIPPRSYSPTPQGVIGSQSGHNSANGPNQNIHDLACPARFERATYALEGRCSIQLSYGQMDFLDFNGMLEPWEFGIGL